MVKDYGRPPRADENRALIEQRLKEIADTQGARETQTIEWRGGQIHLNVIQMPVGDLYYNPGTHRIRAQRSHDSSRDAALEQNPWSIESQEYLGHLLKVLPADPGRIDPTFEELLESLNEYSQNESGLITRDGVLVNGNTRRAALLKIGGRTQKMRVAVLPESCSWSDVMDVELALQLRKEHRRDYSYINRLLAIKELLDQGVPIEKIASTFRSRADTIKRDLWIFSCIESLIKRSESGDSKIPLVSFEDHAEKLRELHRRYQKDLAVSVEKAELTKESRLAAMMLGFSKTDVRLIEPDFQDRYLEKFLPVESWQRGKVPSKLEIPGLGMSVKAESDETAKAKTLTDTVLKARARQQSPAIVKNETGEAARSVNEIQSAMEDAIKLAGKNSQMLKRKQAAPERLGNACQEIDQCVTELVISRGSRTLDEEMLDDAVVKLRDSLRQLAIECQRTVQGAGDGVSWLREVLALENQ